MWVGFRSLTIAGPGPSPQQSNHNTHTPQGGLNSPPSFLSQVAANVSRRTHHVRRNVKRKGPRSHETWLPAGCGLDVGYSGCKVPGFAVTQTPKAALMPFLKQAGDTPGMQALLQRLEQGGALNCSGVSLGAQPLLASLLKHRFPSRRILLVAEGARTQETFLQDVETWQAGFDSVQPSARVAYFPAWEVLPHEDNLPHADVLGERLDTLLNLLLTPPRASTPAPLIVTSVTALLQRTFPRAELEARTRTLRVGDQIDPLDLVEWLEDQAYEPEAQVNHKGDISLRGGILDVFPLSRPWPVRLEFFGDEIESIRQFDPISQMSRDTLEEVTLPPGGELGILKRLQSSPDGTVVPASILDYLRAEDIVLVAGPDRIGEQAAEYERQVPRGDPFLHPWKGWLEAMERRGLVTVGLEEASSERGDGDNLDLGWESLEAFRPMLERAPEPHIAEVQRREFFHQLHRWLRQGSAVHVFCNNAGEEQRFKEIWEEYGLPTEQRGRGVGRMTTHLGALSRGCLNQHAAEVVVTDAEVFGRYKVIRPRRLKSLHAQSSRSLLEIDFGDLEEGDYVVHLQHGIGRYAGLTTLPLGSGSKPLEKASTSSGPSQECLILEYAAPDPTQDPPRLYVPVTEAHLVSKYVGTGKARPTLHMIGGTRWRKAKDQAEQAVRDLAGELLSIQASRDSLPGHAHPPDTAWQREFESAFLYEETPDQMRAIIESKADLEGQRPMDRLICGDVGYGKTEVAIRAAFKTVMGGKQVAILVPTTVLAQQHYNTFTERMADYPVRVELLSRFRSPARQTRTLSDLAAGSVDIIIGTHRLIQKDVAFRDLGLVVIDEEQRFGVLHKENFKRMRHMVDVLTLSATPIPRTLYLALTGARDMSTIETPPQDRLPVETIVTEYDERVIRNAIQRELNRQGQVFYLHNRVFDIENTAQRLRELLPAARILVGHGQMHADQLEEVMTTFVKGDADVLLSTTIIESGIDIPNANTIIIERADRFGLSDLYQLRGRVGRYKNQAYAYLLIPRHARMLTDARKRISAIKQYSTLGSGFKIAMRDLEIRGAGNLLGPQQSGHITAVGFDLYCQLLKQSVAALKGESIPTRIDVPVRLDFLLLNPVDTTRRPGRAASGAKESPPPAGVAYAYLPSDYIIDSRQRIQIYRRLAELMQPSELTALKAELLDRYGTLPQPVERLLDVADLRLIAAERKVSAVETREDKVMLTRQGDYIIVGGKFPRLTRHDAKGKLKELRQLMRAL